MEIRFPTYLMIPPKMRRLGPTVERVPSSESNRYVLDICPLGRMVCGSHNRFRTGRSVRCSANLAGVIRLVWQGRRIGETRALRTKRLESFIRRLQSRYIVKEAPVRIKRDHIPLEVMKYPRAHLRRGVAQSRNPSLLVAKYRSAAI